VLPTRGKILRYERQQELLPRRLDEEVQEAIETILFALADDDPSIGDRLTSSTVARKMTVRPHLNEHIRQIAAVAPLHVKLEMTFHQIAPSQLGHALLYGRAPFTGSTECQ